MWSPILLEAEVGQLRFDDVDNNCSARKSNSNLILFVWNQLVSQHL